MAATTKNPEDRNDRGKGAEMKLPLTDKQIFVLESVSTRKAVYSADIVRHSKGLIDKGQIHALTAFLEKNVYLVGNPVTFQDFRLPRREFTITETGQLLLDTCLKIRAHHDQIRAARDSRKVDVPELELGIA